MLPAPHRLRRSDDFRRAVRRGSRASRATVVVHRLPAPTSAEGRHDPLQIGFVVSRQIGGSVTRNVVTRRLRHLMRDRLSELDGGVVVVRATPRAAHASSASLGRDLDACLDQLRSGRSPAHRRREEP